MSQAMWKLTIKLVQKDPKKGKTYIDGKHDISDDTMQKIMALLVKEGTKSSGSARTTSKGVDIRDVLGPLK